MTTFEELHRQVKSSHARLMAFDAKLNNPKYFQPVIKAEWDRAFDRREALKTKLCRMDRKAFSEAFPDEPNDR